MVRLCTFFRHCVVEEDFNFFHIFHKINRHVSIGVDFHQTGSLFHQVFDQVIISTSYSSMQRCPQVCIFDVQVSSAVNQCFHNVLTILDHSLCKKESNHPVRVRIIKQSQTKVQIANGEEKSFQPNSNFDYEQNFSLYKNNLTKCRSYLKTFSSDKG